MENNEVVLFGTGIIARFFLESLSNKYRVLWAVDNNNEKWGTDFYGCEVKSPDTLIAFEGNIVITPVQNMFEIVEQLLNMRINENNIWLCNKIASGESNNVDIYPLKQENLECVERQLIDYDLLNSEEKNQKKILIFTTFYSVYTKQLVENVCRRYKDVQVSILTGAIETVSEINTNYLSHIYYFETIADLKTILELLPFYDVFQLLWIENIWCYFRDEIRKKTRRLNLCVGGSDFYRVEKEDRDYKKKIIYKADIISAETEQTIYEFEKYYKLENKLKLLPFGVGVLDYIIESKKHSREEIKYRFKIPQNKIVITCGHNAIVQHQHELVIAELIKMPQDVLNKVVFVFPMTYPKGRDDYINHIRSKLESNELPYVILTDFMDFKSMAEYAIISDVMIHVQTTDQLSSTMLEEMFAGSVVLAGSWLPYKSLREKGMYFIDVNKFEDISNLLVDVIDDIDQYKEKCKVNKELVWNHSSWDVLAEKWHELWML